MGKRRSITIAALCLLLPMAVPLLTDNTASADKKKTVLEHADSIEGGEKSGPSGKSVTYRSAIGNVVFLHDQTTLKCDRATDYPEGNRIELEGNILIKNNTVESYGDKGVYYPDDETGELKGNVRGRVVDDSLVAKSKRAVFNQKTDEIWLYDDAVAWHRGRELSGDVIRIHVHEVAGKKKVDEIQVDGHAFLAARDTLSTAPAVYDQLSGQHMVATLDERSRLNGVTATTKAKSLYHIYDEKKQPSGVNFTSGEVIRMFFVDGKLSKSRVTGNSLGKEYPKRLWHDKGIDLPGFRLHDNEKPVFRQ
jgi:lipopolysaccharide export system protein LptA